MTKYMHRMSFQLMVYAIKIKRHRWCEMKSVRNCDWESFEFLVPPPQDERTSVRIAPNIKRWWGCDVIRRCGTKQRASMRTVWHLTWSVKGMNILGKRREISLFKQLVRYIRTQLSVCCNDFILFACSMFECLSFPYVNISGVTDILCCMRKV